MFKSFYNLLINTRLGSVNLFDCLAIAEEYGKVKTIDEALSADILLKNSDDGTWEYFDAGLDRNEATPDFIRTEDASLDIVCVFYQNIFINFSSGKGQTNNDRVIRIYIKDPQEQWRFNEADSGKIDILHPENVNAEVYIDYNVSVLNHNRCVGQEYKSGTWNKMYYRTLRSFIDIVQGYTEINRIKRAYEK